MGDRVADRLPRQHRQPILPPQSVLPARPNADERVSLFRFAASLLPPGFQLIERVPKSLYSATIGHSAPLAISEDDTNADAAQPLVPRIRTIPALVPQSVVHTAALSREEGWNRDRDAVGRMLAEPGAVLPNQLRAPYHVSGLARHGQGDASSISCSKDNAGIGLLASTRPTLGHKGNITRDIAIPHAYGVPNNSNISIQATPLRLASDAHLDPTIGRLTPAVDRMHLPGVYPPSVSPSLQRAAAPCTTGAALSPASSTDTIYASADTVGPQSPSTALASVNKDASSVSPLPKARPLAANSWHRVRPAIRSDSVTSTSPQHHSDHSENTDACPGYTARASHETNGGNSSHGSESASSSSTTTTCQEDSLSTDTDGAIRIMRRRQVALYAQQSDAPPARVNERSSPTHQQTTRPPLPVQQQTTRQPPAQQRPAQRHAERRVSFSDCVSVLGPEDSRSNTEIGPHADGAQHVVPLPRDATEKPAWPSPAPKILHSAATGQRKADAENRPLPASAMRQQRGIEPRNTRDGAAAAPADHWRRPIDAATAVYARGPGGATLAPGLAFDAPNRTRNATPTSWRPPAAPTRISVYNRAGYTLPLVFDGRAFVVIALMGKRAVPLTATTAHRTVTVSRHDAQRLGLRARPEDYVCDVAAKLSVLFCLGVLLCGRSHDDGDVHAHALAAFAARKPAVAGRNTRARLDSYRGARLKLARDPRAARRSAALSVIPVHHLDCYVGRADSHESLVADSRLGLLGGLAPHGILGHLRLHRNVFGFHLRHDRPAQLCLGPTALPPRRRTRTLWLGRVGGKGLLALTIERIRFGSLDIRPEAALSSSCSPSSTFSSAENGLPGEAPRRHGIKTRDGNTAVVMDGAPYGVVHMALPGVGLRPAVFAHVAAEITRRTGLFASPTEREPFRRVARALLRGHLPTFTIEFGALDSRSTCTRGRARGGVVQDEDSSSRDDNDGDDSDTNAEKRRHNGEFMRLHIRPSDYLVFESDGDSKRAEQSVFRASRALPPLPLSSIVPAREITRGNKTNHSDSACSIDEHEDEDNDDEDDGTRDTDTNGDDGSLYEAIAGDLVCDEEDDDEDSSDDNNGAKRRSALGAHGDSDDTDDDTDDDGEADDVHDHDVDEVTRAAMQRKKLWRARRRLLLQRDEGGHMVRLGIVCLDVTMPWTVLGNCIFRRRCVAFAPDEGRAWVW